jgi:hypothetical protein
MVRFCGRSFGRAAAGIDARLIARWTIAEKFWIIRETGLRPLRMPGAGAWRIAVLPRKLG